MSRYEGNTPLNKDHRLYSPLRCKSSFGIILFVKIFKIKMLLRVHLNMCLFNYLHTINGILPEGICLWTTFPLRSAFWHYIHHDESWFLVLERAWITICQRWTRFYLLSLRNPTNELINQFAFYLIVFIMPLLISASEIIAFFKCVQWHLALARGHLCLANANIS